MPWSARFTPHARNYARVGNRGASALGRLSRRGDLMWYVLGAFLCGAFVGIAAMFLWIASTLRPGIERSYQIRRDDFARNDYRSEL